MKARAGKHTAKADEEYASCDDDDGKGRKGGSAPKYIAGLTLLIIVGMCVMNSMSSSKATPLEEATPESLLAEHGEGPMSHGHEDAEKENAAGWTPEKAAEMHGVEKKRALHAALSGEGHTDAPSSSTESTRDEATIKRLKLHAEAQQLKNAKVAQSAAEKFGADSQHVIDHRPHWNMSAGWWVHQQKKGGGYKAPDEDMDDPALINLPDYGGGMVMLEGDAWLTYPHTVDNIDVSLSIWIYLSEVPKDDMPPQSQSSKTIVSTRIPGCHNRGDLTDGFAFFVHKQGTLNRQLRLQWADMESACVELYSEDDLVPYNHWTLVGFSLSKSEDAARIFMGNKIIAHSKLGLGRVSTSRHHGRTRKLNVDIRGRHIRSEAPELLHGGNFHGMIVAGAFIPERDDEEHVTAHCFIGFLGDMRTFKASPKEDADFITLMTAPVDEAEDLVQELTGKYQYKVDMQSDCKPGPDTTFTGDSGGGYLFNSADDSKTKFTTEPDDSVTVHFMPWEVHPKTPKEIEDEIMFESEHVVTPTMSPAQLRQVWPKEYTDKFTEEQLLESQSKANVWADQVRNDMMLHCWNGYRRRGWHHDGNTPVSGKKLDYWNSGFMSWGSVTTMELMELEMPLTQATTWLKKHYLPKLKTDWDPIEPLESAKTTEVSGRMIGGLLGMYSLTTMEPWLSRAHRLGEILMKACNGPAGFPMTRVNIAGMRGDPYIARKWTDKNASKYAILSEVAGIQMEMRMLSRFTMDGKFKAAGDKAFESVLNAAEDKGIIPINLTVNEAKPKFIGKHISVGTGGDRYYEHLLKLYLQTGKREDKYKAHWVHAMDAIIGGLLFTTKGGKMFVAERTETGMKMKMDHVACKLPGHLMLGLSAALGEEVPMQKRMVYRETAEGLMATCYEMYRSSPIGLAGESYKFHIDKMEDDMELNLDFPNATHHKMRHEVVESLYYMHHFTGDAKYREWGYEISKAWLKHCKAQFGYTELEDIRVNPPKQLDHMETWFTSATVKYLWLLFRPHDEVNLHEFVFNADGHPFKIWKAGFIIPDFDEREELPPRFDSSWREGGWAKDYPTWYQAMGDLGMKA